MYAVDNEQIRRCGLRSRVYSWIEQLEQQVAVATGAIAGSFAKIQEVLAVMPAVSALFRLNTQADRRIKELENHRRV